MRHVKKNIKPFIWMIVAAIALLFVQAFADLKLPNYMSDIVNVGIQQNGIKHASPDEISHNGLELIQSILPQKQSDEFKNYYVEKNSDVYTIKSDIDRNEADLLMGETVWTLMNMDIPGMNQGQGQTQMTMTDDFKVEKLYEAIPMFQMLDQSVKETAYEKAHAMEDSLKQQTGIVMAKAFYEELGTDLNSLQNKYIISVGAQMLGMTLLGVVAAIVIGYMSARVGSGFSKGLRRDIFMKIQSFSNEEFDKFSQSSMVVRNVNDVSQVQMMITMGIRMFIYAPIMAIGGIIMISRRDTSMTWIIALTCAILLVLLLIVSVIAVPRFKKMQKFVDRLNLVFRENLSGVMVIRAFGNKKFEDDRFDKANRDVSDLALFVNRLMSLIMPIMMFVMNVTIIAILWFGANQVSDGVLQIGDMMAFMQYSMQIIMSFLMIAMMFIFIPRAIVSLNRITEILDTEVSIQNDAHPEDFISSRKGYVEFKDVDFKYGDADEYVLKDISFTAKPGETTAFIGSTGSGKSTLINLVPRFYDVTSGEVLVNGTDVRHVEQHELRESIGYIPQKGVLLSGTARYNLTYGNENATEEEIKKALEIAQATFILNKEEGLDMEISQGGTNVSGGQKQRISIARALTKHAPIYIFDDSFSALDFKTDKLLRKSIKENMSDATLLIVAQRVNTIMDADQIVVLDNGRIMGIGKHHDLLKSCPTYYEIAASQLSKEELEYEK